MKIDVNIESSMIRSKLVPEFNFAGKIEIDNKYFDIYYPSRRNWLRIYRFLCDTCHIDQKGKIIVDAEKRIKEAANIIALCCPIFSKPKVLSGLNVDSGCEAVKKTLTIMEQDKAMGDIVRLLGMA